MLDMTTAELNERLEAATADNRRLRAQLDTKEEPIKTELEVLKNEFGKLKSNNADLSHQRDAAMETNDRLLVQLDDKDCEIEKLKATADEQAAKIKELEQRVKEETQCHDVACEQVDAQMSDNIWLQFERDTWKQVAKWLIIATIKKTDA
ncbi:MAG: hypothetical protein LUD83_09070 [Clostridiales bacterium]|nr:hypothetical protein [Clostridiales bacterium]